MRHTRSGRKLGRVSEHRKALFRNQLRSLIKHERIITTLAKAKTLRPIVEKVVTLGRKADSVHARRLAGRWLDRAATSSSGSSPRSARASSTGHGGYTRIVKLGPRQGDNAELAVLEFVDFKLPEAKDKAAGDSKKEKKAKQPAAAKAKVDKPTGV